LAIVVTIQGLRHRQIPTRTSFRETTFIAISATGYGSYGTTVTSKTTELAARMDVSISYISKVEERQNCTFGGLTRRKNSSTDWVAS